MVSYLTPQDVESYGSELVDLVQRGAAHALSPQLEQIRQQNAMLQQRLAQEARRNLDERVMQAVPNFREIDRMPEWHNWLLSIDSLSGQRRQTLLDDAIRNTDAGRVIYFFQQFLRQAGQSDSTQHGGGQQHTAARRQASYQGPRIYTRAEITKLYERNRRGGFSEPEWSRLENDIIAAGREGRIENPEPLSGSR